jgi:hypothetical protein
MRFTMKAFLFTLAQGAVLLAGLLPTHLALAGRESSGGGGANELYELRIRSGAQELARQLQINLSFRREIGFSEEQVRKVKEAVDLLQTVRAGWNVGLEIDGEAKDCINDREAHSIVCEMNTLTRLNQGDFFFLVSHEVLSLAELEKTRFYPYSQRILSWTGPLGVAKFTTEEDRAALMSKGAPLVHKGGSDTGVMPPLAANKALRLILTVDPKDRERSCEGRLLVIFIPKQGREVPDPQVVPLKKGINPVLQTITPNHRNVRWMEIHAYTSCALTLDAFNQEVYVFHKEFDPNPSVVNAPDPYVQTQGDRMFLVRPGEVITSVIVP